MKRKNKEEVGVVDVKDRTMFRKMLTRVEYILHLIEHFWVRAAVTSLKVFTFAAMIARSFMPPWKTQAKLWGHDHLTYHRAARLSPQ